METRDRHALTRAWLAHYGAPLYGGAAVEGLRAPGLERVLARALPLSRRDATVARALPVLLWLQRARVDMAELQRRARRTGQARRLGFFLDLTGRLAGDDGLARAARGLRGSGRPRRLDFFPTRGRLERQLAEAHTPPVARDWGYRMNMGMDSFESMFTKASGREALRAS